MATREAQHSFGPHLLSSVALVNPSLGSAAVSHGLSEPLPNQTPSSSLLSVGKLHGDSADRNAHASMNPAFAMYQMSRGLNFVQPVNPSQPFIRSVPPQYHTYPPVAFCPNASSSLWGPPNASLTPPTQVGPLQHPPTPLTPPTTSSTRLPRPRPGPLAHRPRPRPRPLPRRPRPTTTFYPPVTGPLYHQIPPPLATPTQSKTLEVPTRVHQPQPYPRPQLQGHPQPHLQPRPQIQQHCQLQSQPQPQLRPQFQPQSCQPQLSSYQLQPQRGHLAHQSQRDAYLQKAPPGVLRTAPQATIPQPPPGAIQRPGSSASQRIAPALLPPAPAPPQQPVGPQKAVDEKRLIYDSLDQRTDLLDFIVRTSADMPPLPHGVLFGRIHRAIGLMDTYLAAEDTTGADLELLGSAILVLAGKDQAVWRSDVTVDLFRKYCSKIDDVRFKKTLRDKVKEVQYVVYGNAVRHKLSHFLHYRLQNYFPNLDLSNPPRMWEIASILMEMIAFRPYFPLLIPADVARGCYVYAWFITGFFYPLGRVLLVDETGPTSVKVLGVLNGLADEPFPNSIMDTHANEDALIDVVRWYSSGNRIHLAPRSTPQSRSLSNPQ